MLGYELDSLTLFRAAGLSGFAMYVGVYACVGWRLIDADSFSFFGGNTLAAGLVLISNFGEFNLASVLIQVFFIAIGLSAMRLRLRQSPSRID